MPSTLLDEKLSRHLFGFQKPHPQDAILVQFPQLPISLCSSHHHVTCPPNNPCPRLSVLQAAANSVSAYSLQLKAGRLQAQYSPSQTMTHKVLSTALRCVIICTVGDEEIEAGRDRVADFQRP